MVGVIYEGVVCSTAGHRQIHLARASCLEKITYPVKKKCRRNQFGILLHRNECFYVFPGSLLLCVT